MYCVNVGERFNCEQGAEEKHQEDRIDPLQIFSSTDFLNTRFMLVYLGI